MRPGDKVICIKDHSQGLVKKGNVYTINSMASCLQCHALFYELCEVDTTPEFKGTKCVACMRKVSIGTLVFASFLFVPLEENMSYLIARDFIQIKEGLEVTIVEPEKVKYE